MVKSLKILLSFGLIAFSIKSFAQDTLSLRDGSLLVGKITYIDYPNYLYFKNSQGTNGWNPNLHISFNEPIRFNNIHSIKYSVGMYETVFPLWEKDINGHFIKAYKGGKPISPNIVFPHLDSIIPSKKAKSYLINNSLIEKSLVVHILESYPAKDDWKTIKTYKSENTISRKLLPGGYLCLAFGLPSFILGMVALQNLDEEGKIRRNTLMLFLPAPALLTLIGSTGVLWGEIARHKAKKALLKALYEYNASLPR